MPLDKRLLKEAQEIEAEIARRKAKDTLTDPVKFAIALGKPPDVWQAEVLRFKGLLLALLCSRQAGKSTTTAILALHRALTVRGALVLLISPSQRQSSELLLKVKDAMRSMATPPRLEKDNELSISFENTSRIVSLPANESTVRGFSAVNLLIEDEAGDVPDALYNTVRPMLAISNGQHIIMGTPKGREGHFFEVFERGGEQWRRITVKADQIVRYTPGFLAQEREDYFRRGLGDWFRQEYECEFVNAAAGRVYGGYDEVSLIDAMPVARQSEWTFLAGLDFGIQDQNAITVLGWRPHDPCVYVVESYKLTAIPSEMAEEVRKLDLKYNFARIVGDVGGMGKAFAEEARRRFHVPIEAADKHNKLGYIALLNGDLRTGRVRVLKSTTKDLVSEWLELSWEEGGKREKQTQDNHAADSCLYAWRACNAFLENERINIARGTPEWMRKEQEDLLARDLEQQMKLRDGDWWETLN